MGKKKIIIDTNVLISALGWGGKAYEIVDLALAGNFRWITSKAIFEELIVALNYSKLNFVEREEKESFVSAISEACEFVEVSQKLERDFIDPKDNMLLECALAVNADYLISGDKQLVKLGNIGKTVIIPPSKFLSVFKG